MIAPAHRLDPSLQSLPRTVAEPLPTHTQTHNGPPSSDDSPVQRLISHRPVVALATACAAGLALGWLVKRRLR